LDSLSEYENFDFEVDFSGVRQELAIPLVFGEITIEDALDNFDTDGVLNVADDNTMTLVYSGDDIFSLSGEEIIDIEDFEVIVFDTLIDVDYTLLNLPLAIDVVDLSGGNLNLAFESPHNENLEVVLTMQNLSSDNQVLTRSFNVLPNGTINENIDLQGTAMNLENNRLQIYYEAINSLGEKRKLENFRINFQNLEYQFVQGLFSPYTFEFENYDSISIDLFQYYDSGEIFFDDLRLKCIVENSYGIPIKIGLAYFRAAENTPQALDLISPLDQGLEIAYPSIDEIGQSATSTFTFDNSNTNIFEVFNSKPDLMFYKIFAEVVPEGGSDQGFVDIESQIKMDVEIEVPTFFSIKDFQLQHTEPFEVDISDLNSEASDGEYKATIESLEFKLITDNGLPVDIDLQLFFEDDEGNVLATLFDEVTTLIKSGSIDGEGKVIESAVSELFISKTEEDISLIDQATQIRILGKLNTANDGDVSSRFFTDYSLGFKLGLKSAIFIEEE